MAVTDAFATAEEYRAEVGRVGDVDDPTINRNLLGVSRYIERRFDRQFTKDAAPVARDFFGSHSGRIDPEAENPWRYARASRMLHLDTDLVSVTSIVADEDGDGTPETTWAVTDYQLLPLNADKGPEPKPYNALYVPQHSTKGAWPAGRLVRITGVWGWPAVPEAIKLACIHITSLVRVESPRAKSQVSDMGEIIGVSSSAQGIIHDLMRHYGKVTV